MTIAYFDCFSGASGDMIVGALLDAGVDQARLREELSLLGLDGVEWESRAVLRHGLKATKFEVTVRGAVEAAAQPYAPPDHGHSHAHDHGHSHTHDHGHRTLAEVEAVLARLPEGPREQAIAIYRRLADAEAQAHGSTRDCVHFHEVGADDAILDVAAAVLALHQLGVRELHASPLALGSGLVRCAHGVMPVPVPAVAALVAGVPTCDNGERGELLTPTGAAILTTLVTRWGPLPRWRATGQVGYGAGTREGVAVPNLLRVMLGVADAQPDAADAPEAVYELAANLDDLNPQLLAPLSETLLALGALDVWVTPTLMKKGRPGFVLQALCPAAQREALLQAILAETSTLGVRHHAVLRRTLARRHEAVETPWGSVRVKLGLEGQAVWNVAPEFEDCRRLAAAAGVPLKQVWQAALAAGTAHYPR
ncbi:MAG: nickel pincer cofactor biosynthesis protein LarC [Candidatus Sericytochromatia bacterium]|nr:nickel pincer cofactor biosynthesis protein LarC [Candidatus Sericytochromatia bacterium]